MAITEAMINYPGRDGAYMYITN